MNLKPLKFKILFFIMMLLLPINVFARDRINLTADKMDLEAKDEIVLTAKLDSKTDFYALTATLAYDQNVFEKITKEDFIIDDENIEIVYNDSNAKFGIINKKGAISPVLFKIHLTVKDNPNVGNTNLALTNIEASDGDDKVTYDEATLKVLVTRDAVAGETVPTNSENEIDLENTKTIRTFSTKPIIFVVALIVIALASYAIYLYVTKDENRAKIRNITIIALIFLVILIVLLVINLTKKDINDDGKTNYEDAKDIIKYLIEIEGTKKNDFSYDVNNDGRVDVKDVASNTQHITEEINYKVSLTARNTDELYLEAGTVTLEFDATVTNNEPIKEVKINDKYYPVIKADNFYRVIIDGVTEPGIHEFKISKVRLNNGREVSSELTFKKEILKDKPYVDMFYLSEDNKSLNFLLEDKHEAFIKGTVVILDAAGNKVLEEPIAKDNHLDYPFVLDETYTITIVATYDLDSNTKDDEIGRNNRFENDIIYTHNLMVTGDYKFIISDLTITDALEKEEKPVITFRSSNAKNFPVEYIVIDGKQYNVTFHDGDYYEVVLADLDTANFGKYQLDIAEVVVGSLKAFVKDKDYNITPLTYNVLKYAPTVSDINLTNNVSDKSVTATYNLKDDDETLQKLVVSLVDSTEKVLDKKEITPGEAFTLSYGNNVDGRYRVKFLADYNLGTDRHSYTDRNIGQKELLTQADIYIKNATLTTVYPKKNQEKYIITYEVFVSDAFKQANIYNVVSGITINGLNYDADKTKNAFTSTISFTVPSESGVVDLVANRVQLQFEDYNRNIHTFFSVAPYVTKIDVLKDKPVVKNLEIVNEDYKNGSVTFKFDVVDDKGGFTGGTVELNGKTLNIKSGSNEVTFTDVKKDELFTLNFRGDYDLDTNTLMDQDASLNSFKNDLIYSINYGLFDKTKYENLKLTDLNAKGQNGNKYFNKNEDVRLEFKISDDLDNLSLDIDKVIIKDNQYQVSKDDNGYYLIIPGYDKAGSKDIEITDVVLTNGKKVTLTNSSKINIEVLKDKVTASDFNYKISNGEVNLDFKVNDTDNATIESLNKDVNVAVYDEDDNLITEIPYSENMSFKMKAGTLRYYLKVEANYDLDINKHDNVNKYSDDIILEDVISIESNLIELRDINDITLYTEQDGHLIAVEEVEVAKLKAAKDNYFIKLTMKSEPTVYAKIRQVIESGDSLILILDFDNISQENSLDKTTLQIEFGTIKNGMVKNEARPETFAELIARIKANPNGVYTLTHDLDASELDINTDTIFDVDFTGTLNGNGHTIKKLTKPLFKSVTGGTIENLRISDVSLPSTNAQGTLANTANKATIKQVLITGYKKSNSEGNTGTLFGRASNGTVISECKVTDFNLGAAWLAQHVGGFVGDLDSSTIKNSYIVGNLSSNWNYVGAIAGQIIGSSTVENNYSKVVMSSNYMSYAFANAAGGNNTTIKNNIILNSGKVTTKYISGFKTVSNNYQLAFENVTETPQEGVSLIQPNEVNESLFKKANFDSKIWDYRGVSYDKNPTLRIEKVYNVKIDEVADIYDETKETLYGNLRLLMPFYDSKKIVETASTFPTNSVLNKQKIAHIVPLDESGNIVTYLTTANPNKISKLKLILDNNQTLEYSVRYDKTYDIVASYRISDLKIDYTFNHYLIDSESQLVNNLTNYLASLTYEDNLDVLTPSVDNRLYREYYNDVTKNELKEFVLKYLANSNYTNTNHDEITNDYLEMEIKKDQKLEKLLYVYNYFRRFYSVNIGGIMLNDLVLFDSQGFDTHLTPEFIAQEFLADEGNFAMNNTSDKYGKVLGKYTNLSTIPKMLTYYVKALTNETLSSWYAKEFKGYLKEISVANRPDILYTLWDHISYEDNNGRAVWYNFALPLLTMPKNAAYIISTPTQFLIGAQRIYIKNPDDPEQQAAFITQLNTYATKMEDYYNTAAGIINEAKYFNEIHTIQIDNRFTYDMNGNKVFQSPLQTQEPFHKNFNEIFGYWAHQDGNAATANGTVIYWRAEAALQGEWTYSTWSHETAHNIDARLFLKNNGRRFDAGGEDYADGNLSQRFYDSDIVMNLSTRFEPGKMIGANLVPERINSQAKIWDFYQKLFQTLYLLDYLEGEAFLKLTPAEQSKLAVQAFYPNDNKYTMDSMGYRNRLTTVYHTIDEAEFVKMDLKTIDDLTKNQLVMYPGVIYSTIIDNRYGGEGIFKVRWYQPHNDYGRPDSYSLKWFAYEMLGYKGYDDGYIEYYSNINSEKKTFNLLDEDGNYALNQDGTNKTSTVDYKTDLSALRKITGDSSITFDSYKKMRFDETKANLANFQIVKVNDIFNEFYEALKADAKFVTEEEERAKALYPDNVTKQNEIISAARAYKNSTEVRRKYFYAIKNGTSDFTSLVIDKTKPQTVQPLTVPTD